MPGSYREPPVCCGSSWPEPAGLLISPSQSIRSSESNLLEGNGRWQDGQIFAGFVCEPARAPPALIVDELRKNILLLHIEFDSFIRQVMKPCKGLGLNLYSSVIFDELFSCSLAYSFSESHDVLFRAACTESRLLKCRVTKLFFHCCHAIIMLGRQKHNRSWACSAFLHEPSPSSQNSIPRRTPFLNICFWQTYLQDATWPQAS